MKLYHFQSKKNLSKLKFGGNCSQGDQLLRTQTIVNFKGKEQDYQNLEKILRTQTSQFF